MFVRYLYVCKEVSSIACVNVFGTNTTRALRTLTFII